jgi:hypothetical protein
MSLRERDVSTPTMRVIGAVGVFDLARELFYSQSAVRLHSFKASPAEILTRMITPNVSRLSSTRLAFSAGSVRSFR